MRSARLVAALATAVSVVVGAASAPVSAHEPAVSAVLLTVGDDSVDMALQLPLESLELAVELPLTRQPDRVVDTYGALLETYVADHIVVTGDDGAVWSIDVGELLVDDIDGVEHLVTTVEALPSSGRVIGFTMTYDVILERVLSHEIVVGAGELDQREVVGVLNHVTDEVHIDVAGPLSSPFGSMVALGFEHVLDGADHILFLFVLLLPAPLAMTARRRWGGPAPLRSALWKVIQVSTAFTIGHSVTLVASALGWISAPTRAVEVLVAISIGVGAVHVVRPIVRHGEAFIAGGFGLIHGLAFAGILDTYGFDASASVASLFGFNLGVEFAQLAVIAVSFPSLYLLSRCRWYPTFRVVGAAVALAATTGWVVERIGITSNPFAPVEDWAIGHRLVLVAALAVSAAVASLPWRSSAVTAGRTGLTVEGRRIPAVDAADDFAVFDRDPHQARNVDVGSVDVGMEPVVDNDHRLVGAVGVDTARRCQRRADGVLDDVVPPIGERVEKAR